MLGLSIMKKNSNGFTVIEGLLILFIVGIISGVGWYVWQAKEKSDKSMDQAAATDLTTSSKNEASTDETANWKVLQSPDGFSIKLADGWNITDCTDGSITHYYYIQDIKDINYQAGTTAKVIDGGNDSCSTADSLIRFNIQLPDPSEQIVTALNNDAKSLGDFQAGSATAKKYYLNESWNPYDPDGTKEYLYLFDSKKGKLLITYWIAPGDKDNMQLVEKVINSLEID